MRTNASRPSTPIHTSRESSSGSQAKPHTEIRQPAVYGQATFRHASTTRGGAAGGGTLRGGTLKRPPPPRRRAFTSTQNDQDTNDQNVDSDVERDAGGDTLGGGRQDAQGMDQEHGGDMKRPFPRQQANADLGGRRRRLDGRVPERRPRQSAEQVLARAGLGDIAAPLLRSGGRPGDPEELLKSLTAVLVACGSPRTRPKAGAPSPTAVKFAALHAHLASQAHTPVGPHSMHHVKALLMEHPPQPIPVELAGPARTRAENGNLMRPLELFTPMRERTPGQRRRAMDVLELLARAPAAVKS